MYINVLASISKHFFSPDLKKFGCFITDLMFFSNIFLELSCMFCKQVQASYIKKRTCTLCGHAQIKTILNSRDWTLTIPRQRAFNKHYLKV